MKKFLMLISLLTLVLLAGCSQTQLSEPKIKVGVLGDLSGDYANFLRGAHRGAELAVQDIEKELNIEVELIIEDQKSCDVKETMSALNKLIYADKVDFIVGGTCSSTTIAAAPLVNEAKIPLISGVSSAPSITEAGDYVFRTYISDILRADQSSELAFNLGKRKMAILTDITNDATIELRDAAKISFKKLGGEIVAEQEITKEDADFKTQLTKIKQSEPDVLYLSITGANQYGLVAKQAKELGLNVQLITPLETVEDEKVIEIAGETIEGLIYVMPGNPPETQAFKELKQKYTAKYGDELPSYTTETYDATWLGVKAAMKQGDIAENLYDVSKSYQGISGNTVFDENGDVVKPVFFKTIKDGQFVAY